MNIFIFRRDLRLFDNTALIEALKDGATLPVFVLDRYIVTDGSKETNRHQFMFTALENLKNQLRSFGKDLLILSGDPVEKIPLVCRKVGATGVYVNKDYSNYAKERDRKLKEELGKSGVDLLQFRDQRIGGGEIKTTNGDYYKVFTPFKRAFLNLIESRNLSKNFSFFVKNPDLEKPGAESIDNLLIPRELNQEDEIDLQDLIKSDINWNTMLYHPSHESAYRRFRVFLDGKIEQYSSSRNRLDDFEGTSHMDAYLKFGLISIRYLFTETFRIIEELSGDQYKSSKGSETYLSELIWREFYSYVLDRFPHSESENFTGAQLDWTDHGTEGSKDLKRWKSGTTGFPIIDAGIRELLSTGYMHNRTRMLTAMFLTKDLRIDWRVGEKFFARHLIGYDRASNVGGWQWAASTGTDAAPYFRVMNPWLQSKRYDQDAIYIKKFLPELRGVASEVIHDPDRLSEYIDQCSINYPKPMLDHTVEANKAKEMFRAE